VAGSLFGARLIALGFNYAAVRKAVFLSREQHRVALPRYLLLAVTNVALSYSLIVFLSDRLGFHVMTAKIAVESVLFIANFAIQRDFVFATAKR
jgi:putative flippase GtrA